MSADENSSLPPPEPPEPHEFPPANSELPQGSEFQPSPAPPRPGPVDMQPQSKWLPPENFNVPWGWLDVLVVLPLVMIGLIFVFGLIVSAATVGLLHVPAAYLRAHAMFIGIVAQILMELSLLFFFALQIRSRSNLPFWSTIGWRPLIPRTTSRPAAYFGFIVGGVGLALFVSAVSAAFPPSHPLPIEKIFASRALTVLFMATAVLVAPLVEETIFRGYLYPVAARSFGLAGGIIFTGAIFGLLHGMQLWGGWWQIGLLVIVGILFTFARASTRTNLSSFLLHISYNGVQVVAVLVALYGPKHILHVH
jgi:membrane protease YdiL (CAAX protease family)